MTNSHPIDDLYQEGEFVSQIKTPEPQPVTNSAPTKERENPFNPPDVMSLVGLGSTTESAAIAPVKTSGEMVAEIEASRTSLPPYKQSVFKILLIGSSLSFLVTFVGYLMFGSSAQQAEVAVQPTPTPTSLPQADFKPDPNFGVVSAKLAIGEQRKTIEEAARLQQQEAEAKRQQATTAPTQGNGAATAAQVPQDVPPRQPQLITNSQPEPPVPYQPPAPAPISTPASPPQPVARTPKPIAAHQPIARTPKPIPAPQPQPTPKAVTLALKPVPPSQPMVKASLPVTHKPNPSWEIASQNAIFSWHNRTTPAASALVSSTSTAANVNGAAGVLTSNTTNNGAKAIAGQQVAAQLLTPIQILQGQSHQPVVLKLAQAIVDTDGKIAIAAGTQVMADIHIHDNGMLEIGKVVANGRELPQGSFILQGADRQPLLAQVKKFGEGEVRQRDLLAFLGGALQGIGEEITQPQTQTVLGAGGIVQSTNPQGNIVGAVLKGGFTPVNQQWLARNQAAIAKINSAASIWFLPTTTQINLVVAQPF